MFAGLPSDQVLMDYLIMGHFNQHLFENFTKKTMKYFIKCIWEHLVVERQNGKMLHDALVILGTQSLWKLCWKNSMGRVLNMDTMHETTRRTALESDFLYIW